MFTCRFNFFRFAISRVLDKAKLVVVPKMNRFKWHVSVSKQLEWANHEVGRRDGASPGRCRSGARCPRGWRGSRWSGCGCRGGGCTRTRWRWRSSRTRSPSSPGSAPTPTSAPPLVLLRREPPPASAQSVLLTVATAAARTDGMDWVGQWGIGRLKARIWSRRNSFGGWQRMGTAEAERERQRWVSLVSYSMRRSAHGGRIIAC